MFNSSIFKNPQNYGPYVELTTSGTQTIYTESITDIGILNNHFAGLLNIMRDGIESSLIGDCKIHIVFTDNVDVNLSFPDTFINIIMWTLYVSIGDMIDSSKLFFTKDITGKEIKRYIDSYLEKYRKSIDNQILNNIIDDTMYKIKYIDEFSMYLCNTFNIEDFIMLGKKNKEFYDTMHVDYTGISAEDLKKVGMDNTMKMINIIKNSDHCLRDVFRTGEGVNKKQFKEFAAGIGIKPDGQGSVYPIPINNSYINGGPTNVAESMIESTSGRIAQIISKMNVSRSGDFARLLGLNNLGTCLHENPNYVCNTKNFLKITITNENILKMFENRYYRASPNNALERKITANSKFLIGKTIYVRSPETCASRSMGDGICYRCYGDLAYTNKDINVGKFATEELSSRLTQMLLSAKHILESAVKALIWTEDFDNFFDIEYNTVKVREDIDLEGYYLIIDPEDIGQEDEFDDFEFNEYINSIDILDPSGMIHKFQGSTTGNDFADNIYITPYLNDLCNSSKQIDGKYSIPLKNIKDAAFSFVIYNNELSTTLNNIKKTVNNAKIISNFDKDSVMQELIGLIDKSGIPINAVHLEVIISNQLRDADDIIEQVDWSIPNVPYTLLTLNRALLDNPSVLVSLQYQKIGKALFNPLSYRKYRASPIDLFYMERPQNFLNQKEDIVTVKSNLD